jgi:NADH-quinone oxidoreductase subunit J
MNDLQLLLFWLLAGLTGISAILTLVTQNIVRSATWLLFTLGGTAGIFFLLGADFVGAVQLLIYVGGTLVLVVFGVMLTAQGPFITMRSSAAEWAISLFVGLALLAVLAVGAFTAGQPNLPPAVARYAPQANLSAKPEKSQYANVLGLGFLGVGVGPAHKEEGRVVRASYLLPFEIVSVHLLVVLIGAAYLARAKRRAGRDPENGGSNGVPATNGPLVAEAAVGASVPLGAGLVPGGHPHG